jgi:hypothetical protein
MIFETSIHVPPPILSFHDRREELGRLKVVNGVLTFEGNADASARVFIDHVIARYDDELSRLRKENADMLARLKQAGVPV